MEVDVRCEAVDGGVRLVVAGEVDGWTCAQLEAAAVEALEGLRAPQVTLDCSAVTHLDSHGLSALIQLHRVVSERHGRFTIGAASPIVDRLLTLSGLDHLRSAEPAVEPG